VRTETIRPPSTTATPPAANQLVRPEGSATEPPGGTAATEMTRLPPAVLATRAHPGGCPHRRSREIRRPDGRAQRQDPIALWRQTYPDSDGVEILAILIRILETEPVRVEAGTPPEMYVWPYFARLPIKSLTPGAEGRVVPGRPRRRLPGHAGARPLRLYQAGTGPRRRQALFHLQRARFGRPARLKRTESDLLRKLLKSLRFP
jgi:hypothetical protein